MAGCSINYSKISSLFGKSYITTKGGKDFEVLSGGFLCIHAWEMGDVDSRLAFETSMMA